MKISFNLESKLPTAVFFLFKSFLSSGITQSACRAEVNSQEEGKYETTIIVLSLFYSIFSFSQ